MNLKKSLTETLAGTVLAFLGCSGSLLQAQVSTPLGGRGVGIVTQFEHNLKKPDASILIKLEGTKEPARFLLCAPGGSVEPKLEAALKAVFPSNLVTLEWKGQGVPVLAGIRTMLPTSRTGTLTGTVMDRLSEGQNVYLDLKVDGKPTERFWPNWVAGGWNKEVCAAVAATNPGDKVKVRWYYDERRRAVEVSVVSKAFVPRTPAAKPSPGGA